MALSHIGHDCKVANKVIIANGALLAGHVVVDNQVFISGNVVVHQFCRVGKLTMTGGFSAITMDLPPYTMARGLSTIRGINVIGMRRAGYNNKIIREIKNAYQIIFRSGIALGEAKAKIMELNPSKEIKCIVDFIDKSKRGICRPRMKSDEQCNY